MNPLALMAAISKSQRNGETVSRTSREMSVNTEMVKKVFLQNNDASTGEHNDSMPGSQNRKVEEIQRMSGAQIHLPDSLEQDNDGNNSSTTMLTISGTEESILLAQFLVQSNIDMVNKQEQQEKQEPRERDFKGPEGFNFGPNFQPHSNQRPPFGPHPGGIPFNGPGGRFMPHPGMIPPAGLHQGGPLRPLMDQSGMPLPLMQQSIGPPHEGFGPMNFGIRGRGGIRGGPVMPGRGGTLRGGGQRRGGGVGGNRGGQR